MSVHEGFCAPLVEALAHGTPVVARSAGAVPETLAGAGIVVDDHDLAVFAEALHEVGFVARRRGRRSGSRPRGGSTSLAPDAIDARVRSVLAPLLA